MAKLTREDIGEAFREHGPFIGRVILRLMGDGPHVDDLVQETFVVAYQKRENFEVRRHQRTPMGREWDETCLVGTKSVLWDGIPAHLETDALPIGATSLVFYYKVIFSYI